MALFEENQKPLAEACLIRAMEHWAKGASQLALYVPERDTAPIALDLKIVERKIFWLTFALLGLLVDFLLPPWWALGATIPIGFASWWVAYRSDWF